MDAERLAEDCAAHLAEWKAELVLKRNIAIRRHLKKLFVSLLSQRWPRSARSRAALFELWMRSELKAKGGDISGMIMHHELPVLHWMLREQVAEVFQVLAENHRNELQEFVSWFLDEARPHTKYFNGSYKYDSCNAYAFGRPRHAAWAWLAQEVQDAATGLGISFPESVQLQRCATLRNPRAPSRWCLLCGHPVIA